MEKKILWLVVSCLMVAALVLASCAPAVKPTTPTTPTTPAIPTIPALPTTPTTPTTPTAPTTTTETEAPRYGGKFIDCYAIPHSNFDDMQASGGYAFTLHLTNEKLFTGDWTRGPAGTNEWDFAMNFYHPLFEIPNLCESWEIPDAETVIFHIRKGIHYGLNPQSEASRLVNGREMTAQDAAFCIARKFSPRGYLGVSRPGWFKSATATDKYTVTVKAKEEKQTTPLMFTYLTEQLNIYPPEIIEKYGSLDNWSVSCGTGPFFFVDYVPGSSYSLVRNPNYWMKDPIGPGKGNQLPYVDSIKALLILDKSTRIAALRTAKVDHLGGLYDELLLEDKGSLLATNPQLKWKGSLKSSIWCIYGRMDKPELPFKDIRVRQALQMAIDSKKIKDEYYHGEAEILSFPVSSIFKEAYTPLEQLPESSRELFSYNPEKAKKLLTEAGYPNGFKTTVLCEDRAVDLLSIVKDYWSKIGVTAVFDMKERAVFTRMRTSRSHSEMIIYDANQGNTTYSLAFTEPGHQQNLSIVDNDSYALGVQKQLWSFENMTNNAKRAQILKEYNLYCIAQTYAIQLPDPYIYNFWQPWVKNFHGECGLGYGNEGNWIKLIWLDQELKYKMTGRK